MKYYSLYDVLVQIDLSRAEDAKGSDKHTTNNIAELLSVLNRQNQYLQERLVLALPSFDALLFLFAGQFLCRFLLKCWFFLFDFIGPGRNVVLLLYFLPASG
jgi:hypothetical protein